MNHRDLKMFGKEGRDLALWGLSDKAIPIGLVTSWRDDADEATNVAALRDLGTHIRFELQEPDVRQALIDAGHENLPLGMHSTFVYGNDDKGPSAYLLLFTPQVSAERGTSLIHQTCRRVVKRYEQPGHVEWDGSAATLFDRDGNAVRSLPAWDLRVSCLDVWMSSIRPGFVATGIFDRSFSFVQQRWHELQPGAEGT